jgi:hypothetical protein
MNKRDLARWLARESNRSRGQAADEVDKLVYKLLKEFKRCTDKSNREEAKHPSELTGAQPKAQP